MQNAGLGVVLATSTFADRRAVAIPSALFTIWCIVAASTLIAVLRRAGPRLPPPAPVP
jgi:predicted Na+-dependent transporter